MEFIAHRVNTRAELEKLPPEYGVEIDLRDSSAGHIHMAHDPFVIGERFEEYLKCYRHGTMILNIKSERIENRIRPMLQQYGISKYFFLDSSFPMIYAMSSLGERNIALRYSEYEGIDTLITMAGKVNWVWVDCFTKLPLDRARYMQIRDLGYKLCLVSPELQGRPKDIETYKSKLNSYDIEFDAICTKQHNIGRWQ